MATPILGVEEYQYGDAGTKLNSSPTSPFVDITNIDGLDSAPVRSNTTDRENVDGGYVSSSYNSVRTVTLEGNIYANTNLEDYLDTLKANFAKSKVPIPLYFGTKTSSVRCVYGKSQGLRYAKDSQRRLGIIPFQVQVVCGDPRIYTPDDVTTSTSGTGSITLAGNRDSVGTLSIKGPSTNPTIVHAGVTMAFAITLLSTDTLVVDLDTRTVVLNGTTNKRNTLTMTGGGWYLFQPGTNTFQLTGGGTLTVRSKSAWE